MERIWWFGFRPKPIFTTVLAVSKSGQHRLENYQLALLLYIRDTLCTIYACVLIFICCKNVDIGCHISAYFCSFRFLNAVKNAI